MGLPAGWKFFMTVCVLQVLAAAFFILSTLIGLFSALTFAGLAGISLFGLALAQATFAISLLNNNYPDQPVTGKQKTSFNRLYLLNFFFLVFLFGFIFNEFRMMKTVASMLNTSVWELPLGSFWLFYLYCTTLVLQLIILYGLYLLRKELYLNFTRKKFEFEKGNA